MTGFVFSDAATEAAASKANPDYGYSGLRNRELLAVMRAALAAAVAVDAERIEQDVRERVAATLREWLDASEDDEPDSAWGDGWNAALNAVGKVVDEVRAGGER